MRKLFIHVLAVPLFLLSIPGGFLFWLIEQSGQWFSDACDEVIEWQGKIKKLL